MEIGSEIDGFQVWKSGRPRSLVGVMKEAIQGTRLQGPCGCAQMRTWACAGMQSLGQGCGDAVTSCNAHKLVLISFWPILYSSTHFCHTHVTSEIPRHQVPCLNS